MEARDPMNLPGTDSITSLLTSFLNVQSRRSQIAAGNIANADTPGYAAKELEFSDYLRGAAREALTTQAGAAAGTIATGTSAAGTNAAGTQPRFLDT
ncbi:MAG: flagellar basal body rod protein FlgB, partial [Pyrinomonadaceae bacterium]